MKSKPQPPEPRLFNVRMAAVYLGTSVWQVRQLVWTKKLPELRFGSKLMFDRKTLDKYVDDLGKLAA
jgi:excisionase family DNA binding protein